MRDDGGRIESADGGDGPTHRSGLRLFVASTAILATALASAPWIRAGAFGPSGSEDGSGIEYDLRSPANAAAGGCNRTSPRGPVNFYRNPDAFVETFARCVRDEGCRFYYHHVGKTGGTTIEARMFGLFPVLFDRKSCCASSMVDRFERKKDEYCRAKFTSYQVLGDVFEAIVSECMNMSSAESRSVALTSFREPIQRTLSSIHQTCNKGENRRSDEKKRACLRCSYEDDKDIWDRHVQKTNKLYRGVALVSKMAIPNVRVMTIDTVDISLFFEKLHRSLLPQWNVSLSEVRNPESTSSCSFGMKSPIFKALAESEAIYRNLTLGI